MCVCMRVRTQLFFDILELLSLVILLKEVGSLPLKHMDTTILLV